jgi:hypothetical protein
MRKSGRGGYWPFEQNTTTMSLEEQCEKRRKRE